MRAVDLDRAERVIVAVMAGGLLVVAAVTAAAGAPAAWILLGLTAAVALGALAILVKQRRFFEPLAVIMAVALLSFVARPLQLFLNPLDLLSWHDPQSSVNGLLALDTQEISLWVTEKIKDPLEPILSRATLASALFFSLVLVGYLLPWGRGLANRLTQLGGGVRIDSRRAVVACLVLGLAGQVAVLAKVGGPIEAANTMIDQKALNAGFPLHLVAGFGLVAIVIWAAWDVPRSRRARIALSLATLEVCAFYTIAGSRTRVFLLLFMLSAVVHYRWRMWRLRELAVAGLLVLVFSGALLGVRQATADKPFTEALGSAPKYIADPRGVLNDVTEYDGLLQATTIYGRHRDYRYGAGAVDAVRSYVPGAIDSGKPESGDIVFRRLIWGNTLKGGRPYTLIGDLYVDFGFVGIALGALLFGLLARALLGLIADPRSEGAAFRVALFALVLAITYMALITTYSVAIGFICTLLVPFLVATLLIGSWGRRPVLVGGKT